MTTDLRVVSPYRPFVPESHAHQVLGPFDWIDALQMLRTSVDRAMGCETVAITDVDTDLPGPTFHYPTVERRLMVWILEIQHAYLSSPQFDRDTILLSPDLLVFGDLRPWMGDAFVVLMRQKFVRHPILNGVQIWPLAQKDRLIAFYARARAIGRRLPEGFQVWGADTEPLRQLLQPLQAGVLERDDLPRTRLIEAAEILQGFTSRQAEDAKAGIAVLPVAPVLDFRYLRKASMRRYFELTIGRTVAA